MIRHSTFLKIADHLHEIIRMSNKDCSCNIDTLSNQITLNYYLK